MLECFAFSFCVFLQIDGKTCIDVVCVFNRSRLPVYDQKNASNSHTQNAACLAKKNIKVINAMEVIINNHIEMR